MNLRSSLITLSLLLSLVGCERARMSVSGQPGSGTSSKTVPAQDEATAKSDSDAATTGTLRSTGVSGATGETGTSGQIASTGQSEARVYEPAIDTAEPTCEGESCLQPIVTDEGKFVTNQPLRFHPRTHQLDILFVLDTSASMRDEHHSIAREINKFISQLSSDVSYRIGILLAHGPNSRTPGVKVGALYSGDGQGVVIKADEIRKDLLQQVSETELNGAVAKKVGELLTSRLEKLPIDRSQAQGEAGLLNTYSALSNARNLDEMKRQGFMRDEAALLVVFVADENDVCFDYEEESKKQGKVFVGTYASERDRQSERAAFESNETCARVARGQRLTPADVVAAARQAKGEMPVIFTGIHYLEGQVPERHDEFAKDNEAGRGYLEVIRLSDGRAVDLASEDFGKVLAQIGDFSNFRMKYEDTFVIPDRVDLNKLDPLSISVRIVAPDGTEFPIAPEHVRVRINAERGQAEVIIAYEALAEAYKDGRIKEGSSLRILYGLR